MQDIYLSKGEIAMRFGVCVRTVDNWQRRKLIPFIKIGRTVRFDSREADRAIARFTVNAADREVEVQHG